MTSEFRSWEDYYIPGTKVLRNLLPATGKYGETDADRLERFELTLTGSRVVELAGNPVNGTFDLPHLQEIHRRIFCDVYPWAGQLRVGPATRMTKTGPNVVDYAPGDPNAPMVAYGYFPATPAMAVYATTQLALLPGIARIDDDDELLKPRPGDRPQHPAGATTGSGCAPGRTHTTTTHPTSSRDRPADATGHVAHLVSPFSVGESGI